MRSALLAVTLLAASSVPAAARQTVCKEELIEKIRQYEMLVIAYREGDPTALSAWTDRDPHATHPIIMNIDGPCDPLRPWTLERFRAAIMLATDAAEERLSIKNVPAAFAQYDVAIALFTKAGLRIADFAARWFEAGAERLRSEVLLWQADVLLDKGRRMSPHDPRIVYQSGLTAEYMVVANANALEIFARSPQPPSGSLRAQRRQQEDRARKVVREQGERAEQWLTEAAHGGNELAALHLARLLLLRAKPLNALAAADPVLDRTTEQVHAYIAALLGGAAREASGDLTGAAQRYTRAIVRYPDGEFAYVALSHALMRQGRYDDARTALAPVLRDREPLAERVRDPWWLFGSDLGRPITDAFAELRAEARK